MKQIAFVQTPAPDLESSKRFYLSLGFKVLEHPSRTLVNDGRLTIEINDHKFARTGLKLPAADWKAVAEKLRSITAIRETDEGFLAADPNGVRVFLIHDDTVEIPQASQPFGKLGNFVGVSIETVDLNRSVKFWEALGYSVSHGGADQGWAGLTSGNEIDVNLMAVETCPHLCPNPGLTYFNAGKNLEVIENIRHAKIPITQEITCFSKDGSVDNVIIHDPGMTGFFIFND